MFHILFNIAEKDDGDSLAPLFIIAFWIVIAVITWLSKAAAKSRRQQKQAQPGPKPTTAQPSSVDEFLEQIRTMAKGQAGPSGLAGGPEQPLSRPVPPPPV